MSELEGGVQVYYGYGYGKTSAAIGNAIREASLGRTAYIIQFLKGQMDLDYLEPLEPQVKSFRFAHSVKCFSELSEEEKEEEVKNMKNGLMYAKKVLATGECDVLVLDEVLGIIHAGVATEEEVVEVLDARSPRSKVILTGRHLSQAIFDRADQVLEVVARK